MQHHEVYSSRTAGCCTEFWKWRNKFSIKGNGLFNTFQNWVDDYLHISPWTQTLFNLENTDLYAGNFFFPFSVSVYFMLRKLLIFFCNINFQIPKNCKTFPRHKRNLQAKLSRLFNCEQERKGTCILSYLPSSDFKFSMGYLAFVEDMYNQE